MDSTLVDAVEVQKISTALGSLDLKKRHRKARWKTVPYSTFAFNKGTDNDQFFSKSKVVNGWVRGELVSASLAPPLKNDIALMANKSVSDGKKYKLAYLGADLYTGNDKYRPMTNKELDNVTPCFDYLRAKEEPEPLTTMIISARHHIVDIAMSIYEKSNVNMLCTYLPQGYIVITQDSSAKDDMLPRAPLMRKICNSGFALEDLLTEVPNAHRDPFFVLVEHECFNGSKLLLRCETDAYNQVTSTFTEIKCYSKLKLANPQHRKKLLKTWVQTGMVPNSDLVVGIRGPSCGLLDDICWYSRNQLKNLFNRTTSTYDPALTVQWLKHAIQAIQNIILDSRGTFPKPMTFKLNIDTQHNIRLRRLGCVPKNVVIPQEFCRST